MISLLKLSFLLTALGLSASLPSLCLAFAIASIGLSLSAITVLSKRIFCSQNCVCLLTLFSNLMIKQSRACYKLFARILLWTDFHLALCFAKSLCFSLLQIYLQAIDFLWSVCFSASHELKSLSKNNSADNWCFNWRIIWNTKVMIKLMIFKFLD